MSQKIVISVDEYEGLKQRLIEANTIINNLIVANQAAWIEWQHGKGAEKAMVWVHNGLVGPGHIPDDDVVDAQLYFDANVLEYGKQVSQKWR